LGRIGTGAKAGVVSGVVYGIISSITTYMTVLFTKEEVISAIRASLPLDSPITAEQLFDFVLVLSPIFVILLGLVVGVILGVLYGLGYEKIPGRNSVYKGLVIGLGNLHYGISYFMVNLTWNLVISLVFGALLGVFYDKFTPKELANEN
jgi:hypothetical protein